MTKRHVQQPFLVASIVPLSVGPSVGPVGVSVGPVGVSVEPVGVSVVERSGSLRSEEITLNILR